MAIRAYLVGGGELAVANIAGGFPCNGKSFVQALCESEGKEQKH